MQSCSESVQVNIDPKTAENNAVEEWLCIQELCLENREVKSDTLALHKAQNHQLITKAEILNRLKVFKVNSGICDPKSLTELETGVREIMAEIHDIKQSVNRSIQLIETKLSKYLERVLSSFSEETYNEAAEKLKKEKLNYNETIYYLDLAKKYQELELPSMQYAVDNLRRVKPKVQAYNARFKKQSEGHMMEWLNALEGKEVKDPNLREQNNIFKCMKLMPSEETVFSQYFKNKEYVVAPEGKVITKDANVQSGFQSQIHMEGEVGSIAFIDRKLVEGSEIILKVVNLGESLLLGICDLKKARTKKFKNSIIDGYFFGDRGTLHPSQQFKDRKTSSPNWIIEKKDVISMTRHGDYLVFKKPSFIGISSYSLPVVWNENMYPAISMKGKKSQLAIMS